MPMSYRSMLLLLTLAAVSVSAGAQDKFEVFAGYSYLHAKTDYQEFVVCEVIIGCPPVVLLPASSHPNLNGYEFSATYKLIPWLGIGGDFSGHYGKVAGVSSTHVQTFLFGPQISVPGKVSPFVHALFGGAHQAIGAGVTSSGGPQTAIVANSANGFAAVVGGGLNVRIAPFLSLRPIQLDYLVTRFNSTTQSQPRVSAGVVLRF